MTVDKGLGFQEAVEVSEGRLTLYRLGQPVYVQLGRHKVPLLEGTVLPCTHWEKIAGVIYAVCPSSLGVLLIGATTGSYRHVPITTDMADYELLRVPEKWAEALV